MIDPHRDFAEEARAELYRGAWISEDEGGTISVCHALRMTPAHARAVACGVVRLADKLDPPGSFVEREPASAWKRADMIRPPDSGTILARNVPGDVFVVWRSSYASHWCEGDSVFPRSFIEWTEVPR